MEIRSEPTKHAMAWRGKCSMANIMQTFQEHGPDAFQYVTANGGRVTGPLFGRYISFTPEEMELEIGCFVDELIEGNGSVEPVEIPGGQVAVTEYVGPYSGLPGAWNAAHKWFESQTDWEVYGPPMEIYLTDPGQEPDPAKWRTEIVHPVRKKG